LRLVLPLLQTTRHANDARVHPKTVNIIKFENKSPQLIQPSAYNRIRRTAKMTTETGGGRFVERPERRQNGLGPFRRTTKTTAKTGSGRF
jgi:hypothetical protein